jgi:hypothetical protein
MKESERSAIEHECARLTVAYTHYVDLGEAERIAELFTDDGVWEAPGHDAEDHSQPAPLTGPAMVGAYRDRFRRTRDGWRFAHRTLEVTFARKGD